MPAGRPRKYNKEKLSTKCVMLPESVVSYINTKIESGNFSCFNEAVVMLLSGSDKELADTFQVALKRQNELLTKLAGDFKNASETIDKLSKQRAELRIFDTQEPDPETKLEIDLERDSYRKALIESSGEISKEDLRNSRVRKIINRMEEKLAKEKKIIKNKKLLERIIKMELIRSEGEPFHTAGSGFTIPNF